MAMVGRKPKPTALKLIEGNPGKRPLPKREPKPTPMRPPCPPYLGHQGRRRWDQLVKQLEAVGTLTCVDADVLGGYCRGYEMVMQATWHLKRESGVTKSEQSREMVSPWYRVQEQGFALMAKTWPELGIGAASRSRIEVKKADADENPLQDILDAAKQEAAARRSKG